MGGTGCGGGSRRTRRILRSSSNRSSWSKLENLRAPTLRRPSRIPHAQRGAGLCADSELLVDLPKTWVESMGGDPKGDNGQPVYPAELNGPDLRPEQLLIFLRYRAILLASSPEHNSSIPSFRSRAENERLKRGHSWSQTTPTLQLEYFSRSS